jgi:glycerol-3-phosphate acyltransferase PlsY
MVVPLLIAVVSYLIASISFARLVPRLIDPKANLDDVELVSSDGDVRMPMAAMGGNTASIKYGPKVGCSVGLLDILKVFVPTLGVRLLYPNTDYYLIAALAGFIGHCWPIYYRFKGGRGISPFYGGLLAFDPLGALVVAGTSMFLGMVVLKDLLVTYTGGLMLSVVWFALTRGWGWHVGYALLINVLFVLAMIPELKLLGQARRAHGKEDMVSAMGTFPMGRSMLKLMEMLKLQRKQ